MGSSRLWTRLAALCLWGLVAVSGPASADARQTRVTITETPRGVSIIYDLPAPVRALAIGGRDIPPSGVQVRALGNGIAYENGRIRGAAPFRRATLLIEPDRPTGEARYPLLAAIQGRGFVLFAPYVLPTGAAAIRLSVGGSRSRALPRSEADGGFVIVGAAAPERAAIRWLSSAQSPGELVSVLHQRAAALLAFYRARLRRPPLARPTIVISYSDHAMDQDHWLFRGDVTPNGVVLLRFNGDPSQVTGPMATAQFTGFLAHEMFHLWNARSGNHPRNEAWLHEGSADYFAWQAVAALWPSEISIDRRIAGALRTCALFLGPRGLAGLDSSDGSLPYQCGAVAQWMVDVGIRAESAGRRDGFTLWGRVLARAGRRRDYEMGDFRAAARALAPRLSSHLDSFIDTGLHWGHLAGVLNGAGADVTAGPANARDIRFVATRALVTSACGAMGGVGQFNSRLTVNAPEGCEVFGSNPALLLVGGVDPMAEPARYYQLVREACARQGVLELRLEVAGATRTRAVRCTVDVAEPPPDFLVRRALPGPAPATGL